MSSPVSQLMIGKHRLEGLADAVFAIVMTLLVLDLKVPDLPRHAPTSDLLRALAALGPVWIAFFFTFVLAAAYWFLHHVSMHFVHHVNRALCFLNLGFLCFVSLLPFSTGMLGHFLTTSVGAGAYMLNQLLISSFLLMHWQYAQHAGLLIDADPLTRATIGRRIRGLTLASLAGVIGAVLIPRQTGIFFVIVLLANRAFDRRRQRKLVMPMRSAARHD